MVFGLCFICNQRDCQLDSLHPLKHKYYDGKRNEIQNKKDKKR